MKQMIPKYPGTNVPHHSSYVCIDALDPELLAGWHQVKWPSQSYAKYSIAYEYADTHFTHAWTVDEHAAYFENENEAVQFALMFGGLT